MSKYQQGKKKLLDILKGKEQFEETEQASEPDSDMAGMVELSNREFKTTVLRALIH